MWKRLLLLLDDDDEDTRGCGVCRMVVVSVYMLCNAGGSLTTGLNGLSSLTVVCKWGNEVRRRRRRRRRGEREREAIGGSAVPLLTVLWMPNCGCCCWDERRETRGEQEASERAMGGMGGDDGAAPRPPQRRRRPMLSFACRQQADSDSRFSLLALTVAAAAARLGKQSQRLGEKERRRRTVDVIPLFARCLLLPLRATSYAEAAAAKKGCVHIHTHRHRR